MIESTNLWLTPRFTMPGVALLVLSTSGRYGRLHDEIHHLLDHRTTAGRISMTSLVPRAKMLHAALVALYVSVALLSLAGLLGVLTIRWTDVSRGTVVVLSVAGIVALTVAALQLARESRLSLGIIESHARALNKLLPDAGSAPE